MHLRSTALSRSQAAPLKTRATPGRDSRGYRRPVFDPTDGTLRTYEMHAGRYAAASPQVVSVEVAALLNAVDAKLPEGSSVLEVGTGPGLEAAYLEDRAHIVDRTDATAAFVRRLREQGHEARLLDVRDGDLGGTYGVILANAVLVHLDWVQMGRALAALLAATRPGGLLAP
jgi:protein-L-isoaspartate O-methyltransferase